MKDASINIDSAETLLHQLGVSGSASLEEVNKQLEYWMGLQDAVSKGQTTMAEYYDDWGLQWEDPREAEEDALNILNKIVETFLDGRDSLEEWNSLQNQFNNAVDMGSDKLQAMASYITPGNLQFFGIDQTGLDQIQAIIDRNEEILGDYFEKTGKPQTYHVFLRDDKGMLTGFYQTFQTYPEVWQSMLAELTGIEKNTAAALEAEYNIPSWYAVPTRYWAMKTTGTHEFGPAQERLWHMWLEFVADQGDALEGADDALADMNASLLGIDDSSASALVGLNQVNDALTNISQNAPPAGANLASWNKVFNPEGPIWQTYPNVATSTVDDFNDTIDTTATNAANAADSVNSTNSALANFKLVWDTFAETINSISWLPDWVPTFGGIKGSKQTGGIIPETGNYLLHKGELVTPTTDFRETNTILSGSYQALLASQSYLSAINLGIHGLREEIKMLRNQIGAPTGEGSTEFNKVTRSGYAGINSLGIRRI